MLSGREPGDVKWGELGVDVVVEATARYRSRAELKKHLAAGAKRVILCVPPLDEPDITVVMGVNDQQLKAEHRIISNGSITAHCAAPIISIIDSAFGIERMFFTTVHAYTNDQRLADVPAGDLRRSRAASENIIPTDTNAARVTRANDAASRGQDHRLALNVPVRQLAGRHDHVYPAAITKTAVNEVVRTGIAAKFLKYVEYAQDPIVSSDVKMSPYSSTYDSLATTMLGEHMVKTIAWYDNGWGYAHRVVDLIERLTQIDGGLK
jgi:glyceraldehyde 3-phosphate dehydrogenase